MDLIPRRWWTVSAACVVIVGLAALMASWSWMAFHPPSAEPTPSATALPTTIELASRANVWFCSVLCLVGGLLSLQIYLIRRHRGDDYRGHYTIWLWTAGVCLVASFNVAVDFHPTLVSAIWLRVAGQELPAHSWYFELVVSVPLLLLSARLIWEMWESKARWGIAAAASLGLVGATPRLISSLAEADRLAIAHAAVIGVTSGFVISFLLYARFTLLDAHGLIGERKAKRRRKAAAEVDERAAARKTRSKASKSLSQTQPLESADTDPAPLLKAHRPESGGQQPQRESRAIEDERKSGESESAQVSEGAADAEEMIHSLSQAKKKRASKKQRRQQRRAA